ncbi:hypothetical protein U9M48_038851, partial [Paspalum notatum var. saurae]
QRPTTWPLAILLVQRQQIYKRPRPFASSPCGRPPDLGFSGVTSRRSESALSTKQICTWRQQARGGNCITCKNLLVEGHTDGALASYAVAASSFLPPFARAIA